MGRDERNQSRPARPNDPALYRDGRTEGSLNHRLHREAVLPYMRSIDMMSLKLLILVITCARCEVSFTSIVTSISAVWFGSVLTRAAETFVFDSPKIVLISINRPWRFTETILTVT